MPISDNGLCKRFFLQCHCDVGLNFWFIRMVYSLTKYENAVN